MKKIASILAGLFVGLLATQAQVARVSTVAPEGTTWLRVNEESLTVNLPATEATEAIGVESNLAYTGTSDQGWCSVTCGKEGQAVIAAEKNTGAELRTATVNLSAKDNHQVSIAVSQLGTEPCILVKEKEIKLTNAQLEFTLDVTANVEVNITTPEWVEALPREDEGSTLYTFKATQMSEENTSRRDIITVKDVNGKAQAVTLPIEQIFSGYPRFAVISDTHFENNWDEGARVKVPRALRHLIAKTPRIDAIFICGDVTDWGALSQFEMAKEVLNDRSIVPADLPIYVMMGNHDNYSENAQANYLTLGQPLHQLIDIKGYPFITTSMNGGGWDDYAPEEIKALEENLKTAAKKYPGKPIFVFTHVPPTNTVYGTCDGEGGWGSSVLTAALSKYPQVILFGGHSHIPLGDPRSIHQGVFTTINDGSTTYSEIEPGVVNEGIHPYKSGYVTEGCLVSVDKDMNVEVQRWDTYRDEEMLPRWNIQAPHDGSRFVYTSDNVNRVAPVWAEGSKLEVTEVQNEGCTITFPQAVDDQNVHHYWVELTDGDNEVVARHSIFSSFYLNSDMPRTLTVRLQGIPEGMDLTPRVIAWDSYKNTSEPLTGETFKSIPYEPTPGTHKPVADLFDIEFGANGEATDVSDRHVTVRTGSTTPTTYRNEAYSLWTASFPGSGSCFYRVDYARDEAIKNAFTNGFTFETFYRPDEVSGCPMSAQEGGGAGLEHSGSTLLFYCYVGGGYKTVSSSMAIEAGKYYHVVATYDKQEGKLRMYVNGCPVGETEVSGAFGFPGSTSAQWIAIGGDANGGENAQFPLDGDVMVARMYGKAVDRDEVYWMYKDIKDRKDNYQPEPGVEVPVADLFDVQFAEGGSATDISAHGVTISTGSDAPGTVYDETYNMWAGSFNGNSDCHYRIDYAQDETIRKAMQNGFAYEALYKCNSLKLSDVISSQESGGAGLEIESDGTFYFYCHVGGGYKTAKANVKMEAGKYYHVVAAYDKATAKMRVYINGNPACELQAEGDFAFPKDGANWIGIGADAHSETEGQFGLDGTILVARMYGKALSRDEAFLLYRETEKKK